MNQNQAKKSIATLLVLVVSFSAVALLFAILN